MECPQREPTHPLVSIVMPVHDQEQVLNQTLESICAQSLRNFELLLVDDGSSDGSAAIEREFADRDPRIQLFSRTAQGAALARNFGLGAAAGRYVIFLDSDDLFHPDLLLNMASVLEATGADICICEADQFFGTAPVSFGDTEELEPCVRIKRYKEGLYGHRAFGRDTFQLGSSVPWNKMYRCGFLTDIGAFFQDTKSCNDCFFVAKAMREAHSVYLLKETLVLYRRGLGTSIQDERLNHPQEALRVAKKLFCDLFEKSDLSDSEAASLRVFCTSLTLSTVIDCIATGTYSESAHEHVNAFLRRLGSPGIPRTLPELKALMRIALITRATQDKVIWAHSRWGLKARERHTPLEKIGYALRIAVAIARGN